MRTQNLFRTLVAASLAVVSMSIYGQKTTTGTPTADKGVITNTGFGSGANQTAEWVDIVTVGSTMPYSITPDADVEDLVTNNGADFKASVFNWNFTLNPSSGVFKIPIAPFTAPLTEDDNAGGGLSADGTPYYAGYYTESDVLVTWGAVSGVNTISVTEQSQNTLGLPGCADATPEVIDVWVMEKPTLTFTESNFNQVINGVSAANFIGTAADYKVGGCGVSDPTNPTNIYLPLTLTGADQFVVKYTIQYTDLTNTPSVVAGLDGSIITTTKFDAGTNTFLNLASNVAFTKVVNNDVDCSDATTTSGPAATASDNAELIVTVPAASYGKYVVTLESVSDRISRKSFTAAASYENAPTVGSAITIWALPTPTTGRIRHVDNGTTAW